MTFDFPLILTALMVFTGVVSLVDIIYLAIRRRVCPHCPRRKEPLVIEYARAFFPVFLIVLLFVLIWETKTYLNHKRLC